VFCLGIKATAGKWAFEMILYAILVIFADHAINSNLNYINFYKTIILHFIINLS